MNFSSKFGAVAVSIGALLAFAAAAPAAATTIYTESNAAGANQILIYETAPDGRLIARDPVATGGLGAGGGLGSQGALALSENGRVLLAVNAGSNDVTTFQVRRTRLVRIGTFPSGGARPTSVAVDGDLVYVLNAGGSGNISGFRLDRDGRLNALPNSSRPLSTSASAPAEVGFNRSGDALVVTERATNKILVFPVNEDGRLGNPAVNDSNGATPFGFEFDRRDNLFVSEAFGGAPNASALSSYRLNLDSSALTVLTGSAATDQSAACWVAFSENGRFAYVTNTGSGTVTGYAVSRKGALSRLGSNGVTGVTEGNPLDAVAKDQRLFVLSPRIGRIVSFTINGDGGLARGPSGVGVSSTAAGLVAW